MEIDKMWATIKQIVLVNMTRIQYFPFSFPFNGEADCL
jgi:hypothetical protein